MNELVVGELKFGNVSRLYVLVERTRTATIFKVGILPSDEDFSESFQRTVQIVLILSANGADRNVPFLYVLVELRFQSTAQIVADRNMEIFNGSDVLEILQV